MIKQKDLGLLSVLGLIVKQGEKILKDPTDFKATDARIIVTAWPEVPEELKAEPEYKDNYDRIEKIFNEQALKELPGFDEEQFIE